MKTSKCVAFSLTRYRVKSIVLNAYIKKENYETREKIKCKVRGRNKMINIRT